MFALALGLAGCASRPAGVVVVFSQTPPELPFDPQDARLRAVQGQLAELLGHGLQLDVDTALLPAWGHDFRDALTAALENLARDVRALRDKHHDGHAAALAKLTRVECRYSAVPMRQPVALSEDGSTLTVHSLRSDGGLIGRGTLYSVIEHAVEREQTQRFADASPSSVAPAERQAYFKQLRARLSAEGPLAEGPLARAVLDALTLRGSADSALVEALDQWLASDVAREFTRTYSQRGDEVRAVAAGSSFRRAEAAYASWAEANAGKRPPEALATLLRYAYPRLSNQQSGRRFSPLAFPGWNRDALLLQQVEAWSQSGHPSGNPAYDFAVCPRPRAADGSRASTRSCERVLYERAQEEPKLARALSDLVLRRNDPTLTEMVFSNLSVYASNDLAVAQWRALLEAGALPAWRQAALILNEDVSRRDALYLEESKRVYRERPGERGLLLYLLASADAAHHGVVDWAAFADSYGSVGPNELRALFAVEPGAVGALPLLWDALTPEAKRAELLLTGYDAFLSAPDVRVGLARDKWSALRTVHYALCSEGQLGEVETLRSYYQARARIAPTQARVLNTFASEIEPSRCKAEFESEKRRKRMQKPEPKRAVGAPTPQPNLDPWR